MKINVLKIRPLEKGDITQHVLYFTFCGKDRKKGMRTTNAISLSSPGKTYGTSWTLIPTIVFSNLVDKNQFEFRSWNIKLRWLKWDILTLGFDHSPYISDYQEDTVEIPAEREEGTAAPITWQDYEQV